MTQTTKTLVMLSITVWWIVLLSACGVKRPPRPPKQIIPPAVTDLAYELRLDTLLLTWTEPTSTDWERSRPTAFRIYRSKIARADADCENCPLPFQLAAEIPLATADDGEFSDRPRFTYTEELEPGYRYVFKVRGVTSANAISPDSNLVRITFW